LAERASAAARRDFGLSLHWGAGAVPGPIPLVRSYQAALAAADSALVQGTTMVTADAVQGRARDSLRRLRQALGSAVEERPDLLGARFDRYVEAVVAQCGHALDASRGHLDAGFEWMAGVLLRRGTLDERSFGALGESLERAAGEARTLGELTAAYRRAVDDVSEAVRRPVPARQDRSVRHAVAYIEQHYAEPLRLQTVARVAGLAPVYFSKVFKRTEATTFEQYVRRLRIERAKQFLTNTGLSTARVAEMTGFSSAQYFCRVFREATGKTPGAYRSEPPRREGNKVQTKGVRV
jgi:AraC-like DNA-binding protein